jgi:mono/diheme cytochrome c family protein
MTETARQVNTFGALGSRKSLCLRKSHRTLRSGPSRPKFKGSLFHSESSRQIMKRKTFLLMASMAASAGIAAAGDVRALWGQNCASCHGEDGSGSTMMGKKLGLRDFGAAAMQSSFSDAEAAKVIREGKGKMKAYGGMLSEADIKALIAYVRSLKK